jgi:putative transposase
LGATLAFEDESGFSLVSPLKGTWAPRGQTPVIRTQISHHQRINAIGALLVTPGGRRLRLLSRLQSQTINGQHVVAFLKKLLHSIKGSIVWVWDNHPMHSRQLVKAFIAQHPRLHVYHFPAYAPELNPVEGIWAQAKEYTAGSAPHHMHALHRNVSAAVKRTADSPRRLRACFRIAKLPAIT